MSRAKTDCSKFFKILWIVFIYRVAPIQQEVEGCSGWSLNIPQVYTNWQNISETCQERSVKLETRRLGVGV